MTEDTQEQFIRLYKALYSASVGLQFLHVQLEGESFYSLHILLEEMYDDVREHIDHIGERIDRSGGRLPSTPSEIELDQIAEVFSNVGPNPSVSMSAELASQAVSEIASVCEDVIDATEDMAEEDIAIGVKVDVTDYEGLLDSIA